MVWRALPRGRRAIPAPTAPFNKDNKLHYVLNYVGAQEFHVESNEPVPEGKAKLRYEFEPTGKPDIAKGKGSVGRAQLYMNDKLVGQTELPVTVSLLLAGR